MTRSGLLTFVALIAACDTAVDLPAAGDLEQSEPEDNSRTKDEGGPNGDFNYCDGATLCLAGEGDCDIDAHCAAGLVCGVNNGGQFGLQWSRDVCVDGGCTNGVQDGAETGIDIGGDCGGSCGGVNGDNEGYCTIGCPCLEGEGDCDSNSECAPGLACINNQGDRFGAGLDPLDDVCIGELGIENLRVGDVIITEIMSNPLSVGDAFGEWFEIFNTTNIPIDLNGLIVRKNAGGLTFTINVPMIIAPGGYKVFAKNGNGAVNGGVTEDFDYTNVYTLNDVADSIILDNGPLDIDRVVYNANFPNPNGSSMELDIRNYDDVANNAFGSWCASVTPLPGGDNGTPGADNRACP